MTSINLTKIKKKLNPTPDGQDVLRLRSGIVSAINADGTCDVIISGATEPGVPRLQEASVQVDAVVQMLSYRGSLLIIGRSASGGQSAGLGLWARGQATSNGSISGSLASLLTTNTVTFVKNRVYEIKTHGGVQAASTGVIDLRAYRAGPATQIAEFYRFPVTITGSPCNATGGGIYFTTAANVSGAVALYGQSSLSSPVHFGSPNTPRNIEVWDVGDASEFSGITTW